MVRFVRPSEASGQELANTLAQVGKSWALQSGWARSSARKSGHVEATMGAVFNWSPRGTLVTATSTDFSSQTAFVLVSTPLSRLRKGFLASRSKDPFFVVPGEEKATRSSRERSGCFVVFAGRRKRLGVPSTEGPPSLLNPEHKMWPQLAALTPNSPRCQAAKDQSESSKRRGRRGLLGIDHSVPRCIVSTCFYSF